MSEHPETYLAKMMSSAPDSFLQGYLLTVSSVSLSLFVIATGTHLKAFNGAINANMTHETYSTPPLNTFGYQRCSLDRLCDKFSMYTCAAPIAGLYISSASK